MSTQKNSTPRKPQHRRISVVEGISSQWFLKHFPLILLSVFMAMAYISVRFDCVTAMETVAHLRQRLEVTRTETQRERSAYMSATCERAMQARVDSLAIGLHIQEKPAYILEIKK